MKIALVILPFLAALSACASGPQATAPVAQGSPSTTAAQSTAKQDAAIQNASIASNDSADASTTESLPSTQLTEEILVKYLSAELAEQRGSWQAAYVTFLQLAQQTRDPRIAKRAVEVAMQAKRPSEALAAVRLWRELAPRSEEAIQYYLGFVVLSDNLAEAKPVLQQYLKSTPPQALGNTILQIQRLLARAKDKNAASALLTSLVAPYQSIPEAHLALAQSAFLQGDFKRAAAEAQAALALAPGSELAALTLAQVTPDKSEAAKSLAKFLQAHPQAREARLGYARLLVEAKDYEEARTQFKLLLKDNPQDLTALYALGLLAAQSNDLEEAERYLTAYIAALTAQPNEERDPSQALLLLAQIAEERKDTQAALKWLEQITPNMGQAYRGAQIKRAQLLAKQGNLDQARRLLAGLSSNEEAEKAQLIIVEAQILQSAKRPDEAMRVLEKGIKRFPRNTDLLYDYGMLAEKNNKLDIMEAAFRKIIKIAPSNQHAYNALGYSFADRNIRLQEAFTLISKALALAPEDPFIMDSMGWVQYRLGRLKEAEAVLRRAYEKRPDPEIAAHLGEVLWMKGQQEDAKKLWRDANRQDPKNDTLKNTLTRLQVSL